MGDQSHAFILGLQFPMRNYFAANIRRRADICFCCARQSLGVFAIT